MLITSEETAALIGVSLDHFRRSWRDWTLDRGFPRPASPSRRFKWIREDVEAWMVRQSRPEAMEVAPPPATEPTSAERQRTAVRNIERVTRGRTQPPTS